MSSPILDALDSTPNEVMSEIGRVLAAWEAVDGYIDKAIWEAAGLSRRRGRCFTAHMSFPLKCDVVRALLNARRNEAEYDKALKRFLKGPVHTAFNLRNELAHAEWIPAPKGEFVTMKKLRRNTHHVVRFPITKGYARKSKVQIVKTGLNLFSLFLWGFDKRKFDLEAWKKGCW